MKNLSEASRRYAKALFQAACEKKNEAQVLKELKELGDALQKAEDVQVFFASAIVSRSDKSALIQSFIKETKLSDTTKGLLQVLAENNRLDKIIEIAEAFQEEIDKSNKVLRGQVVSGASLSDAEKNDVKSAVKSATGKDAILNYSESSEVLGGLVAEVGSYRFDGSLETQLRLLNEELNRSVD